MDKTTLTPAQRQIRMNVRNFLLVATIDELKIELAISEKTSDTFRAACVQELLDEAVAKVTEAGYQSPADCIHAGLHLVSVDKDGYCNCCGEQDSETDLVKEMTEAGYDKLSGGWVG